jgi:hypothetical protein
MSRLFDRMVAQFLKMRMPENAVRVQQATVVCCDEIAQFWSDTLHESTSLDDWTRLAIIPPFRYMFVEMRRGPLPSDYYPDAWALDVTTTARGSVRHLESREDYEFFLQAFDEAPDLEYIVVASLILEDRKRVYPAGWSVHILLDKRGYSILPGNQIVRRTPDSWASRFESDEQTEAALTPFVKPLLASIALMNAKNIELIDNPPPPKLSRSHEKKYGKPLVNYKTIKINPMRIAKHYADLERAPASKPDESKLPLSLWRGHFKDYRDGKGLFGNLKGVYWWNQHLRGSLEHGVTIKDYEVQKPDKPPPAGGS